MSKPSCQKCGHSQHINHRCHSCPGGICQGPASQANLFSAARGEQLREEALQNVEEGAPTGWVFQAMHIIEIVARTHERFTPDNIWEAGLGKPPEPRALGAAMRAARKAGYMEPLNEFVPSRNPLQHRTPIRVWHSLIYA